MEREYIDVMYLAIPGFKNYRCTSDGSIYSTRGNKYICLKVYNAKNGYCTIQLTGDDGKMRNYGVHTIVASAWLPKPDGKQKYVVNHKNCNKRDNRVENLEYIKDLLEYQTPKNIWESNQLVEFLAHWPGGQKEHMVTVGNMQKTKLFF